MANFGPLSMGQVHPAVVDHCVFLILNMKVTGSLVRRFLKPSRAAGGVWTRKHQQKWTVIACVAEAGLWKFFFLFSNPGLESTFAWSGFSLYVLVWNDVNDIYDPFATKGSRQGLLIIESFQTKVYLFKT